MANIMFNFAKFDKTLTHLIVEFANICQHNICQNLQVFSGICQKLTKLYEIVNICQHFDVTDPSIRGATPASGRAQRWFSA